MRRKSVVLALLVAAPMALAPGAYAEDELRADVSALVRRLGARLHIVRATARAQLTRIGARSVPALVQALRDPTRRVRMGAAMVLGRIGDPGAIEALQDLLVIEAAAVGKTGWHDPSLAYRGCVALARCGAPGFRLADEIAQGRVASLEALEDIARRALVKHVEPAIVAVFNVTDGSGSYPGRFVKMRAHGWAGVQCLLGIAKSAYRAGSHAAHAGLAIQALGDGDHPSIAASLEALFRLFSEDRAYERLNFEVAHSLFRLGEPARMNEVIEGLERRQSPMNRLGVRIPAMHDLAHRYLHAGRLQDAVKKFRDISETNPNDWGNAYYNAACAWSRASKPKKALEALRKAILPPRGRGCRAYSNLGWMQRDGDLSAARKLPEFDYLSACLVAADRLRNTVYGANLSDRALALELLERAHKRGFRIRNSGDRDEALVDLCGDPIFERLWKAMGGTLEGRDPSSEFEPPPGDGR